MTWFSPVPEPDPDSPDDGAQAGRKAGSGQLSGQTSGQALGRRSPRLDTDALLDDPGTRTVVCCGSGGVGKTTMAAVLALRAAERGRKVAVLTIDPARRLAQALGLGSLDDTPREVTGIDAAAGGSLHAMMLDMKRTFDEIVYTHAPPDKAEQILENPFYQALSSSFAGTQEYMAMEKLGQLSADAERTGRYDLIVVDTPPSRSALDFLDAPQRLSSFLDGRLIRILTGSTRGPVRLFSSGMHVVTGILTKVVGRQVLHDLSTFVSALDTTLGGFRERAEQTYRQLQRDHTAFLVVAAPEPDALREASFFIDRLREESMPLAGLIVNRVCAPRVPTLSAERSLSGAETLEEAGTHPVAAAALRVHANQMRVARREQVLTDRFSAGHRGVPLARVSALPDDVHDREGLRTIGTKLVDGSPGAAPLL